MASQDGRDGSVTVNQDANVWAGLFDAGERASFEIAPGRGAWVHVVRGAIELGGELLETGDAAAIDEPGVLEIAGKYAASPSGHAGEVLVFDLG